jgi:hypothetical protein
VSRRKLVHPLKFILLKIGKTGYWFNQTFIPMSNYLHYWMEGDEALVSYRMNNRKQWFWPKVKNETELRAKIFRQKYGIE